MANFNFDASTVAPKASSSPVPAGSYVAHITDSDVKTTKAGTGQFMSLTFEILDGQFKGRKVFNNLNIQNENADTQSWALADLSAICHSVGVIKLQETSALHYKPLKIKVTVKEASGGYEASNQIKGYESATGVTTASTAPTQPAANSAPAAGAPAWAKRG